MTLSLKDFTGEIPREAADRLPVGAAQVAVNCEFSHGELRSLKGLGSGFVTSTRPVRGLFTDNGLRFFIWDRPTRAFLHPTIDDTLRRVIYQTHGQGIRVAQTDTMKLSSLNPSAPTESWKAGVKPPATAPTLGVEVAQSWDGDAGAQISIDALIKVGSAVVTVTTLETVTEITRWQSYDVLVPPEIAIATSGTTALTPGSDGYITIPDSCVVYAEISGTTVFTFSPGTVKVNASGQVKRVDGVTLSDLPLSGGALSPTAIDFRGKVWMPASSLYTGLNNGTASGAIGTASDTAQTIEFRITIRNQSTGTVYLTQDVTGVEGATGPSGTHYTVSLDSSETVESVAYVAVAINTWGEESAPSPAATIEKTRGQQVRVTGTHTTDAGQVGLRGIAIYRTYASNQSAAFLLVGEAVLSSGSYTFVDATNETTTTTALTSSEWDAPPDSAANLTYVGNGSFAASLGKDLLFSEPYRPHAWPYRMSFPHGIVGVVAVEGGALVTTQAQSYIVSGAHPTQMNQQLLPVEQAGWSDTAMTRVDGAAVFAGNDGLVSVSGGQPSLSGSLALFAPEDWRARYSAVRQNMRLAHRDGRVLGLVDPSYPSSVSGSNFLITLDSAKPTLSRLDFGTPVYCAVPGETTDQVYVGNDTGVGVLFAGNNMQIVWQSGDVKYSRPRTFAAAIIDCEGDFFVTIFADQLIVHALVVVGRTEFRLPPHARARRWSVSFEGIGTVRSFEMGNSFRELQAV